MNTADFLSDLEKWQASSHPELVECQPNELFHPDFVERYQVLHNHLWLRMVRLHGTISTLEQIVQFPFDYLYVPHEMAFWDLVRFNFFDTAILILHGLVNDSGRDANTLRSFKNELMTGPWLCQEMRDLFKQTYDERKFDRIVNSIAERVDVIRDNCVAHPLINKETGRPKVGLSGVTLEELRSLFDASHLLFGAITFGSTYSTLAGDLTPSTIGGKPSRTCLDEVLDAVLRDSDFVNTPERRAPWWSEQRKYWPVERLQMMNKLRKRIGLSEG